MWRRRLSGRRRKCVRNVCRTEDIVDKAREKVGEKVKVGEVKVKGERR